VRTYGEAVDVRPARPGLEGVEAVDGTDVFDAVDGDEAVAPGQFLWRGRLYVVRAVLAHWVELGPWWTGQTGTGSTGARPARRAPVRSFIDHAAVDAWSGARAAAARTAVGEPEPSPAGPPERPARSVARDVGAVEREVWRVEARAGRSSSVGVYDLVRDVPPPDPAGGTSGTGGAGRPPSRWRLARALD
jgi:hypothetical protein